VCVGFKKKEQTDLIVLRQLRAAIVQP